MPEAEPYKIFLERLNTLGAPYMVSGSIAVILYGEPRMTHDVDVILDLDASQLDRLPAVFPEEQFYLPPAEVLKLENRRESRGHFNIIHHATGYKADIYPVGRDPLHQWAMQRVKQIKLGGLPVNVAPPEYVILRKLEFFREGGAEKHIRDIRSMLEVSAGTIVMNELDFMINERGLAHIWQEITGK